MATRQRDTSLGKGVFYAREDYVGIGRRFIILVVDASVLAVIITFLGIMLLVNGATPGLFTILSIGIFWVYEVILKRSATRTVGYRLTRSRIVNLQGERPSLFALTFRALLWLFGPFMLLFDLLWSGIDDDRQTLRDRFAETCLINENAAPIGTGEIHLTYFDIGLFNLAYARVTHPK